MTELTEYTEGSLQSSDASVTLQDLQTPLSCYKHVYTCLTFSTVRPLISILLEVELMAKCLLGEELGNKIIFSILLIFLGFSLLNSQACLFVCFGEIV